MNNYCVYKHTTPSGKSYIGITRQTPQKRWKNGLGYKRCHAFWRAIQKYGWENITHEIVADGLTETDACEMEQRLIAEYGTANEEHGYNLTYGGEHYKQTYTSRKKLSDSLKRFYEANPEEKKRVSAFLQSVTHTEESDKKRGESLKKYIAEHPESREEFSKRYKGKTRPQKTKDLMSLNSARARPIVCVETGVQYKSTASAAREHGICSSSITQALNGRSKSAHGFHWRYAN